MIKKLLSSVDIVILITMKYFLSQIFFSSYFLVQFLNLTYWFEKQLNLVNYFITINISFDESSTINLLIAYAIWNNIVYFLTLSRDHKKILDAPINIE